MNMLASEREWRDQYGDRVVDAFVAALQQSDEFVDDYGSGALSSTFDAAAWLDTKEALTWSRYADRPIDIDLSPLRSCTCLKSLALYISNHVSLKPLAGLTNLQKLSLRVGPQADLSPIGTLSELVELDLLGAELSDWAFLTQLGKLEVLAIRGFRQHVLPSSALCGIKKLSWFAAITDLDVFSGAASVVRLTLQSNVIRDLSALRGLNLLEYLDIRNNRVEDLSPLSTLNSLRTVLLDGNCIVDFSPLDGVNQRGDGEPEGLSGTAQLDTRHPIMARILESWNDLSLWADYARWLQDQDDIRGLELQEKLEGGWTQLPEHWAPAEKLERRIIDGQWYSRNIEPLVKV